MSFHSSQEKLVMVTGSYDHNPVVGRKGQADPLDLASYLRLMGKFQASERGLSPNQTNPKMKPKVKWYLKNEDRGF